MWLFGVEKTTSKMLIKSWKTKPYIKISTLKKTILSDLVDESNRIFKGLYTRKFIKEKELKYFSYDFKKTTNLGKLYLIPKIHKQLYNIRGRPLISNCRTPTENGSAFLDFHLKPLTQSGWSYIRDSGDFIDQMNRIKSL